MSSLINTLKALSLAVAVSAAAAAVPGQAMAAASFNGRFVQGVMLQGDKVQQVMDEKHDAARDPDERSREFDSNAVTIEMIIFPEAM